MLNRSHVPSPPLPSGQAVFAEIRHELLQPGRDQAAADAAFGTKADREFFGFLGHHPWLHRESEDLFQAYCIAMIQAGGRFDPSRGLAPDGFLLATAFGALREQARRIETRRQRETLVEEEAWSLLGATRPDDGAPLESLELAAPLRAALRRLQEADLNLVLARSGCSSPDGQPESWSALSLRCGLPEAALKARLATLLAGLRAALRS